MIAPRVYEDGAPIVVHDEPVYLDVAPSSQDFGVVETGHSSTQAFTVTCRGATENVSISFSLTGTDPGQFASLPASPIVITPGGTALIQVSFWPTSAGAKSAILRLQGSPINCPVDIPLTGEGVAPGSKSLSISPSNWQFPSQKVGTTSSQKVIRLTNTGTVDCNVASVVVKAGGIWQWGTLPGGPFLLHPGDFAEVAFTFTPAVAGYAIDNDALTVNWDGAPSPILIALSGIGYIVDPVYIVSGPAIESLIAFAGGAGASGVCKIDPNDFDCEEDAFIERVYDYQGYISRGIQGVETAVGFEKKVNRVLLRYEDLGPASLEVHLSTNRRDSGGTPTVQDQHSDLNIGTTDAGEVVRDALADLEISGDLLKLKISRVADAGPVQITEIVHHVEVRGEIVEGT